jgi:peroxiredoxin
MRSRLLRVAALAALIIPLPAAAFNFAPTEPKPVPEITFFDGSGNERSLADFRGEVVVLNLWATWCAPCRHETPFLQSLYEQRRDEGLEIVGISMDTGDARDQVEEFVREFGVRYPILLDPQMRGMDSYRVLGLPASFLIDRDGTLRWMRFGPVSADDDEFMKALGATLE